jgi:maltooligosyltrehalose synthase
VFKFLIDVLFMKRIGLGRPLRNLMLLVALGVVIAGAIYFTVVVKAVQERSHGYDVHAHNSR